MRVYDSAYRKTDVTKERTSRILKLREMLSSFRTSFNLVVTVYTKVTFPSSPTSKDLGTRQYLSGDMLALKSNQHQSSCLVGFHNIPEQVVPSQAVKYIYGTLR